MRAILAAAARGEEKPMEHHADTRVRLPIALWIRPPRACSMRPRWKISLPTSGDEASKEQLDRLAAKQFLDTTSLN